MTHNWQTTLARTWRSYDKCTRCAAGGTLASLGHGYLIDGWGASA